jgi:hypothetical protein
MAAGGCSLCSHARFVLEAKGIRLEVSALLLASFAALPSHPGELAAATLRRLSLAQGLPDVVGRQIATTGVRGASGVQWPLFARSE